MNILWSEHFEKSGGFRVVILKLSLIERVLQNIGCYRWLLNCKQLAIWNIVSEIWMDYNGGETLRKKKIQKEGSAFG